MRVEIDPTELMDLEKIIIRGDICIERSISLDISPYGVSTPRGANMRRQYDQYEEVCAPLPLSPVSLSSHPVTLT